MNGFIPEDVVARVIAANDIVEVIQGYLPLKPAGRHYKALCPFHAEKTPSFVVNPEKQIFKCFGCGEGGDAVTFLMKQERFTFPEAVRYLAGRAGISLPSKKGTGEGEGRLKLYDVHQLACDYFRRNLRQPEGAKARGYLESRGVSGEVAERFLLGYALPAWDGLLRHLGQRGFSPPLLEQAGLVIPRSGKQGYYDRFRDRLMIAIQDGSGRVIGFGGRSLDGSEPKYLNSPETSIYRKGSHLYGLNLAATPIREMRSAIVVEGYFDLIALHVHGVVNSVAVLGTALTGEQARLLARYANRVLLTFDPDTAGLAATRRLVRIAVTEGLECLVVDNLPEGKDPDLFIREQGTQAFGEAVSRAKDLVTFLLDRRVSGFDLGTIDGQEKAVNAALPLLAAVENLVMRSRYVQELAQKVGISNLAIVEQLNRLLALGGRGPDMPLYPPKPKAPASAEWTLLHIALYDQGFRERIFGVLEPEDFVDPVLKKVFLVQRQAGGEGAWEIPISQQDPDVREALAEFLATDLSAYEGVLEKMVADCLDRVKARRARKEREGLRKRLAEAERAGDRAAVEQILKGFQRGRWAS